MRTGFIDEVAISYRSARVQFSFAPGEQQKVLSDFTTLELASAILNGLEKSSLHNCAGSGSDDRINLLLENDRLRELGDYLSYAAYRLQVLAFNAIESNKSDSTGESLSQLLGARVAVTEHLYRLVFTLAKVYLDERQRRIYLQAARDEVILASGEITLVAKIYHPATRHRFMQLLTLAGIEDRLAHLTRSAHK